MKHRKSLWFLPCLLSLLLSLSGCADRSYAALSAEAAEINGVLYFKDTEGSLCSFDGKSVEKLSITAGRMVAFQNALYFPMEKDGSWGICKRSPLSGEEFFPGFRGEEAPYLYGCWEGELYLSQEEKGYLFSLSSNNLRESFQALNLGGGGRRFLQKDKTVYRTVNGSLYRQSPGEEAALIYQAEPVSGRAEFLAVSAPWAYLCTGDSYWKVNLTTGEKEEWLPPGGSAWKPTAMPDGTVFYYAGDNSPSYQAAIGDLYRFSPGSETAELIKESLPFTGQGIGDALPSPAATENYYLFQTNILLEGASESFAIGKPGKGNYQRNTYCLDLRNGELFLLLREETGTVS